jgi:hypothetical protein
MTTIKLKNGSGAPTAGDLVQGEPALDLTNKRLYTEDSGGTVIEVGTNPGTDVTFADNRKAIFGAGSDLKLYHTGSHSYIDENGTGNLYIGSNNGAGVYIQGSGETLASFVDDGAVTLNYDNTARLATTSTGIDVTGDVVSDGLTTNEDQSGLMTLGRFSSGFAYSLIRPSTNATGLEIRTFGGNATARFLNSGVAELYNNASKKLETTATGIDVTGTVTADNLTVSTSGTNAEAYFDNGAQSYRLLNRSSDNAFSIFDNTASAFRLTTASNGDISFYEDTGTTAKFFWDADAESLGIGTTSPIGSFTVADSGTPIANPASLATVHSSTTDKYFLKLTSADFNADGNWIGLGMGYSSGYMKSAIISEAKDAYGRANLHFALNNSTSSSNASLSDSRMVIDYSGNVGIGTSSPTVVANYNSLSVNGTNGSLLDSYTNGTLKGRVQSTSNDYLVYAQGASTILKLGTNNTERMRIDSSGNLLVGKSGTALGTAGVEINQGGTAGKVWMTRSGDNPLLINRLSTDGSLVDFYKDGTTVGNIGVDSGDNLYIGGSVADHGGLYFGTRVAAPINAGTLTDDVMDLGTAGYRFKDLYLSGGAYLGGTGSANLLDDYEEGTWTPTITGSTSGSITGFTVQEATYTKIGDTVRLSCYLSSIDMTASTVVGTYRIGGLPFIGDPFSDVLNVVYCNMFSFDESTTSITGYCSGSVINLHKGSSVAPVTNSDTGVGGSAAIMLSIVYKV